MVGSLFSGYFVRYGRWRCIIITNALVIGGSGVSVIRDPDLVCLFVGRVLYGIGAGGCAVFCPKYLAEVAPKEIRGQIGGLSQMLCVIGQFICFTIGFAFHKACTGERDNEGHLTHEVTCDAEVYLLLLLPIVFSVIQVICMMTVFNYDTPVMIKK